MNSVLFWNIVSATIIGVIIHPIISFFMTMNAYYLLVIAGIILIDLITIMIKYFTKDMKHKFILRPQSKHCDILCQREEDDNIGMPSEHMAILTFFVFFVYIVQIYSVKDITVNIIYIIVTLIYIMMMAYARYTNKCHNEIQIVSGAILGILMAFLFAGVFGKYIHI